MSLVLKKMRIMNWKVNSPADEDRGSEPHEMVLVFYEE